MISLTKSKKNKSHKYISKEKTVSGSWKYIYKTIKTGITRTQAERDKLAEAEGRNKPKDDSKKKNSALKTAASILTKKRKPNSAKTDYVNKYVKNGKDYVSEWYTKANDNLHNFTVRSASANKCRKKASSLRDLLTQEV